MNKKFLSAILFGALMVTSTGTFVSCKDYDDDIDAINSELVDIKSQLSSLQSQVNSGKYVTNVTKKGEGIVVTWNDGTTSTIETIKGDKGETGATGAAGAKGEATVITIDPVTKNWVVDGVDTGICSQGKDGLNGKDGVDGQDGKDGVDGKDGQDGKDGVDGKDGQDGKDGVDGKDGQDGKDGKDAPIPTFTVGEDGHIYVQYGEDGEKLDLGTSTGGIYVVENGLTVTLHVCDAEGNWNDVVLPTTKVITDLQAVSVVDGQIKDAEVTLYYGYKVTEKDGLTFNGKTYAKNTYLLSQNATLSAIVNPFDADATKYEFALVDTKGNAPFIVSDVKQNVSEKALSRAATANKGVWDLTLAFANAAKVEKSGTYALTTESANGTVASPYDVNVTCAEAEDFEWELTSVTGDYNTEINLTKAFLEEDGNDWTKYIVDYYFEIADKTAAKNAGISLVDGKKVKCTTNKTDTYEEIVKVHALLVDGSKIDEFVEINVNYVAPTSQLSNVKWTINEETNVVYVSLKSIQAQLAGAVDTDLPEYAATGKYTWTDGTELDKKTVVVNENYYGKKLEGVDAEFIPFAGNEEDWITTLDGELYVKNAKGKFVNVEDLEEAAKIQDELFAAFTFDASQAFPGEYIVYVGFKKAGESVNTIEVPVKVTIQAPVVNPFARLSAYFNGDEATAYGKVVNNVVEYNLFDLFKAMASKVKDNVTFSETTHKKTDAHATCTPWILDAETGAIEVAVYDNTPDAINVDAVYTTRAIKAVYEVFGNEHIANVVDEFNLTVKSEIYEGKLEAAASASVSGTVKETMKVSMKNITAKDVYGAAYNLGETYIYNASTKEYDVFEQDERIASVKLVRIDSNAKEYLAETEESELIINEEGYPYFEVKSASDKTALQSNVTCKLALQVTDVWGKIKTTEITVTLKK